MAAIWHPFTQMKTAKAPIEIVKGKGVYLTTRDGIDYLDGISSWWVNLHGHSHPYIAEKIADQAINLEHVIFSGFTHPPALEFTARLLPILPGKMGKIFYSDNGSTAVEVGLKIALQYWYNQSSGRTKIIAFKGGYHGDTFGTMSVAGKNRFNRPFWDHLFDVITITPPIKGLEEKSMKELETALSFNNVACFLFEPLIQGVSGMVIHSSKALNHLLKICREHEVITIADEVMTGFGRTETLFACDNLEEKPDIICLSKGITGGFLPLGATACKERIYQAFHSKDKHRALLHGHSYTANPLACASACASLDLLQAAACEKQRKRIASAHINFVKRWKDHPKLKRCESIGTILALEYKDKNCTYFSTLSDSLYQFFIERKILLRPLGNVLYVLPPYCISKDELTLIYNAIALTFEGDL
ncbi:MAG: adenosylmethionine--8-amino-7-oxononanoate transaminase [Candidatus Neptunochlamydia sp.]|nr:adenosylmethionine--8-amino-7-oxononanoate transaminase [Candidatus Neptunochlamydia sp.]